MRDGRMIGRTGQEAFLDVEGAEVLGVEVGDEMTLGFFGVDPDDPTGDSLANPLGRSRVRVVGIGTFADEPLPEKGFPRTRILVTPAVAAEFDCLQQIPDPDRRAHRRRAARLARRPRLRDELPLLLDRRRRAAVTAPPRSRPSWGDGSGTENENLPAVHAAGGDRLLPDPLLHGRRRPQRRAVAVADHHRAAGLRGHRVLATVVGVLVLVLRHLRRREREVAVWRSLGLTSPAGPPASGSAPVAAAALGALGGRRRRWSPPPSGPWPAPGRSFPHPDAR